MRPFGDCRYRQEDGMRARPLAGITALALLASLAGCAEADSTGAAGTGQASSVTATSPAATLARGTPSAPASSDVSTTDAATPVCGSSDLKITLVGAGAATAAVAAQIGFTNLGTASCHLTGYPLMTGITAGGGQVIAKHLLTTEFGPNITGITAVTLAPRATAIAVVTGNDVVGTCGSGATPSFRHLLIQPPGRAAGITISAWLPTLSEYLPDCSTINVTPVAPAASVPKLGSA
jgi:hypothetical protein